MHISLAQLHEIEAFVEPHLCKLLSESSIALLQLGGDTVCCGGMALAKEITHE